MTLYIVNRNTGEVVAEIPAPASREKLLAAVYDLPVDYYIINYGGYFTMDLWEVLKRIL